MAFILFNFYFLFLLLGIQFKLMNKFLHFTVLVGMDLVVEMADGCVYRYICVHVTCILSHICLRQQEDKQLNPSSYLICSDS